jgi:HD-like signal output (HDOD) protein
MMELDPILRDALLADEPVVPASAPLAAAIAALDAGGELRLDHLARLALLDPAVAAELLSAGTRPPRREVSLHEATQRVGDAELLRIARGVTRAVPLAGPLAALRDEAWRAASLSALLCGELARARGLAGDLAHACGLLHRVGALAALAAFERLAAGARPGGAIPLPPWQHLADRWSVPLGLAFARRRGLPAEITDAMAASAPDAPAPSTRAPLVAVVRSVDAIVTVLAGADPAQAIDLAGLTDEEADRLARALHRFEAYLGAIERTGSPADRDEGASATPRWRLPAGERRAGAVPVASLRERKGTGVRIRIAGREYAAVGFAAHQLLVAGPAPLWEGALLEVEVLDRRRRAFHARVLAAWAEGARFGALLLPFGLSGPALADLGGGLPAGAAA